MADFTDVALVSGSIFDNLFLFDLNDISFPELNYTDVALVVGSSIDPLPADNFEWTDISYPSTNWIDVYLQGLEGAEYSLILYLNRVYDTVAASFVTWTTFTNPDQTGSEYPGPGTFGVNTSDFIYRIIN